MHPLLAPIATIIVKKRSVLNFCSTLGMKKYYYTVLNKYNSNIGGYNLTPLDGK